MGLCPGDDRHREIVISRRVFCAVADAVAVFSEISPGWGGGEAGWGGRHVIIAIAAGIGRRSSVRSCTSRGRRSSALLGRRRVFRVVGGLFCFFRTKKISTKLETIIAKMKIAMTHDQGTPQRFPTPPHTQTDYGHRSGELQQILKNHHLGGYNRGGTGNTAKKKVL